MQTITQRQLIWRKSRLTNLLTDERQNRDRTGHVHELIQELYALPLKGNDLKQAMEKEENARRKVVDEGK